MTVQDFIVNYSATFEYLHRRFGKEAVVEFWKYLGSLNTELYDLVGEKGLVGYLEYFYGANGTCSRESVVGDARIDLRTGEYVERIDRCPSVGELRERGKRPYRYYCEHCYWLYNRSLEDHGFHYDVEFALQPEGGYSDHCVCRAHKREDAK